MFNLPNRNTQKTNIATTKEGTSVNAYLPKPQIITTIIPVKEAAMPWSAAFIQLLFLILWWISAVLITKSSEGEKMPSVAAIAPLTAAHFIANKGCYNQDRTGCDLAERNPNGKFI